MSEIEEVSRLIHHESIEVTPPHSTDRIFVFSATDRGNAVPMILSMLFSMKHELTTANESNIPLHGPIDNGRKRATHQHTKQLFSEQSEEFGRIQAALCSYFNDTSSKTTHIYSGTRAAS